jgi:hypothetical protein
LAEIMASTAPIPTLTPAGTHLQERPLLNLPRAVATPRVMHDDLRLETPSRSE